MLTNPEAETASGREAGWSSAKTHVKNILSVNKSEIWSPQRPTLGGTALCASSAGSRIFGDFFTSFCHEKIKDPYNDVGSAALEVVANNWKSLNNAEIYCFQISHRFATKNIKAYTMLRWTALKFVAAPRTGPIMDPGFSIRGLIRDRSFFCV